MSLTVPVINNGVLTVASGILFRDSDTAEWVNSATLAFGDHNGYDSVLLGHCVELEGGEATPTCGPYSMTNTGTIVKLTGTLTSALRSTVLTNAGALSTQTGTLNIRTEDTTDISGTVKATANAQVTFDGADTLLFDTGDTITGAGTMGVTVPTAELATTPTINGLQAAANAQLVLDHDTTLGTLNLVQNGHLTGPGSVAVTHDMTLAGTVASSGDVTVTPTATLTWDGGDWAGTGTTTLATGSSTVLTGGSIHGRTLTTAGTVDFQTGILTTTHGAIDNTGAWTFDQTGDTPPPSSTTTSKRWVPVCE